MATSIEDTSPAPPVVIPNNAPSRESSIEEIPRPELAGHQPSPKPAGNQAIRSQDATKAASTSVAVVTSQPKPEEMEMTAVKPNQKDLDPRTFKEKFCCCIPSKQACGDFCGSCSCRIAAWSCPVEAQGCGGITCCILWMPFGCLGGILCVSTSISPVLGYGRVLASVTDRVTGRHSVFLEHLLLLLHANSNNLLYNKHLLDWNLHQWIWEHAYCVNDNVLLTWELVNSFLGASDVAARIYIARASKYVQDFTTTFEIILFLDHHRIPKACGFMSLSSPDTHASITSAFIR
jgi:hypothetical protein